jgi:hypothetical protein
MPVNGTPVSGYLFGVHRIQSRHVGLCGPVFRMRLLRQRVSCCVARAQAGVLLRRLKFALPGWTEAESRRGAWAQKSAQRAAQARAFSGEGHSEEWGFFFSGSSH